MPLFRLTNVVKVYSSPSPSRRFLNLDSQQTQRTVLQIDELAIHQGEILAVVGPSGAGKSTLLRLLNFLDTPESGSIEFAGQHYSADQQPALGERRRVTTVFQTPALLNRSVYDNVAYGLQIRGLRIRGKGVRRAEQDPVMDALTQVGLDSLAQQQANTLSGGEKQRVALARALVLQPDVLLLDEPTANLDPQNVAIIESIISDLNQRVQTTIVLVTNNLFQARRLAHRMVFLLEGKVVEVGETEAVFTNPTDPRTNAFVNGEMIY